MPILWPADQSETETLVNWASDRLGLKSFGPCTAIGVVHKSRVVAVAVFSEYRHPNIEITFVTSSPRWASPQSVRAIFAYPFKQLGCRRITAITEATNQPARAFLCRLGFKQEGIHPDALPNGTAITYGLLARDAARWLEDTPSGKIYSLTAASA